MFVLSFHSVKKRDGRIVPWDSNRILIAISKAMQAAGEGDIDSDPQRVAEHVVNSIAKKYKSKKFVPSIELIQDEVEQSLFVLDFQKTAKAYILYRYEKQKQREARKSDFQVPVKVRTLAEQSKKAFRNQLAEFIYFRTYSRWLEEEGRRETWIETVRRYVDFMRKNLGDKLSQDEYAEIFDAIYRHEIMPSMRLLWSAGPAAEQNNVAAYNCSYTTITRIEDFAEVMFVSMSGAGCGFSVESEFAQQLPLVKKQTEEKLSLHVVEDSKEGWCDTLTLALRTWWDGKDIEFDYSKVRPAGARLKTMGGRSSGPEPLRSLLTFARKTILSRQGRRLRNVDVHDLVTKIADVVVSGGVRRSALLSLSDLDDEDMRHAKDGAFYIENPQRKLSNNSAVYNEKPDSVTFMREWLNLAASGSGERGVFNRGGLKSKLPKRRLLGFRKHMHNFGTNPCSEIILRSKSFCNLSEVVCRIDDTEETLLRKVRLATILGTYQSTLTNFTYLSEDWKKNCEEERLLGVSLTGQLDSPVVQNAETQSRLREESIRVNKEYAERFGVNQSVAITCTKPSGTCSQMVDSSSGIHPRYSPYYIRRVRISATDPLFHMLRDQGWPYHPEVGESEDVATTFVLDFPIKSPEGAITRNTLTAIDQLEYWKRVKVNYTEHNPSFTCYVNPDEWLITGNWVYQNWDIVGGLSFLPKSDDDHVYALAPYEEITKEQYDDFVSKLPAVDFAQILAYEHEDKTEGAKELACSGSSCEIV